MCQLCTIPILATSSRWPKPLEPSITNLIFAANYAHEQYTAWQTSLKTNPTTLEPTLSTLTNPTPPPSTPAPPPFLLETTRTLSTALASLHDERLAWWKSKSALVKKLTDDCETSRLTEMHKINNSAVSRIQSMEVKVGGFVRWGLGVRGGFEALMEGDVSVK